MGGYGGLTRAVWPCVQFITARDAERSLRDDQGKLDLPYEGLESFKIVYINAGRLAWKPQALLNEIAVRLELRPIAPDGRYLRWEEEIEDLVHIHAGMVIVIDNAHVVLMESLKEFCDLAEMAQMIAEYWAKNGKPFHLCFQMEPNPVVREFWSAYDQTAA